MIHKSVKFLCNASFAVLLTLCTTVLNAWSLHQQDHPERCCVSVDSTVNCDGCNLTELPLKLMTNTTERLLLANNMITDIPGDSFYHMESLRTLTISDNPFREFHSGVFEGKLRCLIDFWCFIMFELLEKEISLIYFFLDLLINSLHGIETCNNYVSKLKGMHQRF